MAKKLKQLFPRRRRQNPDGTPAPRPDRPVLRAIGQVLLNMAEDWLSKNLPSLPRKL